MAPHLTLRAAQPDDAGVIAGVHVRSWQAAYAGLMAVSFLQGLSVAERAERWRRTLKDGLGTTVVVERAGCVEAFIHFGPCRNHGAPETEGEIWALYATPEVWDCGAGRELLAYALRALRRAGFHAVSLWVLQGNHRAIRFYEAAGFVVRAHAQKHIRIGETVLQELAFARPLGD